MKVGFYTTGNLPIQIGFYSERCATMPHPRPIHSVFIATLLLVTILLLPLSTNAQFGGMGGGMGGMGGGMGGMGGGMGGMGGGMGGMGGGMGGMGGGMGGGAGGIYVDPAGVLRVHFVMDPRGQLTRQRLAEARAGVEPELARPSKLRKISLNRLEAFIADRIANGTGMTDDMKYLAGLTRLQYVFYYPETGDIVIAGPAEGYMHDLTGRVVGMHSGRSVLTLEDLVVALRAFPPTGSDTNVISVSIDPTKEGLAQMQQFLRRMGGRVLPKDTYQLVFGLQKSLGLQTVTIKGISPKTHFAHVLAEADYRMKLIGIGLEVPPVKITSYVARANPSAVSRNALQRWYFTPNYESVRVSEDQLAMEMVGEGVKLIGANELVTGIGSRIQSNVVDRASQLFVKSFTSKYAQLARKSPVFAQLRNLIDMSIAAAFIRQQDYYSQANWEMELFNNEAIFPVELLEEPKTVETAVNAIWKGKRLMTPIGGGINIQPRQAITSERLLADDDDLLDQLHETVDIRNLEVDRWWWD